MGREVSRPGMTASAPMFEGVEAAGRAAFRTSGAAGEAQHAYPLGSEQRHVFLCGYWSERFSAADRARLEGRPPQARMIRQ